MHNRMGRHLAGLLPMMGSPRGTAGAARLAVGLLAAVAVLSACSGVSGSPAASGAGAGAGPATTSAGPTASPTPTTLPVAMSVSPANGTADVRPDAAVAVQATNGRLTAVTMSAQSASATPADVPGALAADGSSWAPSGPLLPGTTYTVAATGTGADGKPAQQTSTFTTVAATATLKTRISPLQGETVGVGMPIQVTFNQAIDPTLRAGVQKRLSVTTSVPVEGVWSWRSDKVVEYRPKVYWPAGTQISLGVNLVGVDAGGGTWGTDSRTVAFAIGHSVVSTVDVAAHTMSVNYDGAVAKVIPITTGKEGFTTRGGIKLVEEKFVDHEMNSESIGIKPGDPEYYDLSHVMYAMRVTNSGEFLHAAPWSVGSQGRANVSHGCTGMSMANAKWLFNLSQRGDVVSYVNSARGLEPGNGFTEWNVPWDQWVAKSAV